MPFLRSCRRSCKSCKKSLGRRTLLFLRRKRWRLPQPPRPPRVPVPRLRPPPRLLSPLPRCRSACWRSSAPRGLWLMSMPLPHHPSGARDDSKITLVPEPCAQSRAPTRAHAHAPMRLWCSTGIGIGRRHKAVGGRAAHREHIGRRDRLECCSRISTTYGQGLKGRQLVEPPPWQRHRLGPTHGARPVATPQAGAHSRCTGTAQERPRVSCNPGD